MRQQRGEIDGLQKSRTGESGPAFRKTTLIRSGECEKLGLELLLGDAGTDDLVLHLAVLEEQQEGDRLDVELHREIARFIDVDLADNRLAIEIGGDLVDDGSDHFARTAPLCPEVDEDGFVGIKHFGLEVRVCKFQRHGGNMDAGSRYVKSRPTVRRRRLFSKELPLFR